MKSKTILKEFHDLAASRCAFSLRNGNYYEGYIIEVEDRHLRFASGGPMATHEDLLIPIEAVDLNTLSYWDKSKTCYMNALWNENQQKWVFK